MPCISLLCSVKRKRDPHLQTLGRTFWFILEFRSVAPNSVVKVRSSGSNRNSLDKDMTRPVLGSSRLSVRLWPCLREMPSKANGRPQELSLSAKFWSSTTKHTITPTPRSIVYDNVCTGKPLLSLLLILLQ